ncbi:MAG: gliding motility-associated C-terminal domain-containing protein [Caldilineaceae bacterium]
MHIYEQETANRIDLSNCYTLVGAQYTVPLRPLYIICTLLIGLLTGCGQLQPSWGPLLYNVSVTPDAITPNADGNEDVTRITYSLRRSADVSIYFTNEQGEHFYFRHERRRARGDYNVLWGGTAEESTVVETDYGPQEILSRVLPDGTYTWTIIASEDDGNSASSSGTITLQNGDTLIPELNNFAVVPETFSPNQDSIQDWVSISYYLTKDVDSLTVYLLDPAEPSVKYYIAQEPGLADPNAAGYKEYRYEGDVDKSAEPPPDGTYTVVGEARDRAGNAVRVTRALTIVEGGQPFAEIDQGEIEWYVVAGGQEQLVLGREVSLNLGDKLCLRAVVHNYGTTPIRTAGPWPGQEYLFTENRNSVAMQHIEATMTAEQPAGDKSWLRQSGAWRFGINFESTGVDFPFRWAVGRQEDLERRIIDGNEQWYLLPNKRGKVSGCVEINQPPLLNTNIWWGGLIHEDVATVNNDIDRITVVVESPPAVTSVLTETTSITATPPVTGSNGITATTVTTP